ncbi:protein of unknown function [Hyphomicrobium sp. MC1]|nr:protein of unknown function [Hyphomicrobium sp. MC1]
MRSARRPPETEVLLALPLRRAGRTLGLGAAVADQFIPSSRRRPGSSQLATLVILKLVWVPTSVGMTVVLARIASHSTADDCFNKLALVAGSAKGSRGRREKLQPLRK